MKTFYPFFILITLIVLSCNNTPNSSESDFNLSEIRYNEYQRKLFQYKRHPNFDSIINTYEIVAKQAVFLNIDKNDQIRNELDWNEISLLSDIQNILSKEVTKSITITDKLEIDSIEEFLNKRVEFTSIHSFNKEKLINHFNKSANKNISFDYLIQQSHSQNFIVRSNISDWPRNLPNGDYRKEILNVKKGDIVGPIYSSDAVSYLRIDRVVEKDISKISNDSIKNTTLLLKKHSYINNKYGKCIYDAQITILPKAVDILQQILKHSNINDIDNTKLDKTLANYLHNSLKSVSANDLLKYNRFVSLKHIKNDRQKLKDLIYNYCKQLVIYNNSLDIGLDTIPSIKVIKDVNRNIKLHNLLLEKLAQDSIIKDTSLAHNYYDQKIKNYTSHNKLVVSSIQFSNINQAQQVYQKYKNTIFDHHTNIVNSFNYQKQYDICYNDIKDLYLKEVLFFYNVLDKRDIRFHESDNGIVTIYKVIDKSGEIQLPFCDVEKIVNADLLQPLKDEIKKDIIKKHAIS